MTIRKAAEKDIPEIIKIISKEFPYTNFSEESMLERIKNPNIYMFKKIEGKKTIGFIEIELKEGKGLINGLSIAPEQRMKGFGKKLLNHALSFLKKKGIPRAVLLVKKENENAKKLYNSFGFEFKKNHSKKIEDSVVEVWEKQIEEEAEHLETYLN